MSWNPPMLLARWWRMGAEREDAKWCYACKKLWEFPESMGLSHDSAILPTATHPRETEMYVHANTDIPTASFIRA